MPPSRLAAMAALALSLAPVTASAEAPGRGVGSGRAQMAAVLKCDARAAKAGTPQSPRPLPRDFFKFEFSPDLPDGVKQNEPIDVTTPTWLTNYPPKIKADVKMTWLFLRREQANFDRMMAEAKVQVENVYGPNHPNWPMFEAMIAERLQEHRDLFNRIESGKATEWDVVQFLFTEKSDHNTLMPKGLLTLCFKGPDFTTDGRRIK